jgi:hypothetical protein
MLPSPAPSIYRLYESLYATLPPDSQAGLGGKLLYAGAIRPESRNLLYAANIAGAASLAASAEPVILREAMRDGVIDFLVNSLEEALRILKNEIRKRQTVSVGVSIEPHPLVAQMTERGVLPDLLPPVSWPDGEASLKLAQAEVFLVQGAKRIADSGTQQAPAIAETAEFVTWSLDKNFARWLPRLDACAQAVIPADDLPRLRWLRLAPRYLGKLANREHGVALSIEEKIRFTAEVEQLVDKQKREGGETPKVTIAGE